MKTAVWLYLFLFVAFFDLHAQYPVLTPFAVSLGAAPSFIGLMMGLYALTHLPGNLLAGYGVDRFGSRFFIVASLTGAGAILLVQSRVTDPWQLLVLRSVSGFVLAFLSPACMALLAGITRDRVLQGKLMAGNGLVHTLASVVSPAAGAWLVARVGFAAAFEALGWLLLATGLCALAFIRNPRPAADGPPDGKGPDAGRFRGGAAGPTAGGLAGGETGSAGGKMPVRGPGVGGGTGPLPDGAAGPYVWLLFLLPLAVSCSQGILFFELPLMNPTAEGAFTTSILFSLVSIGSLATLSLLFLNRLSAFRRTAAGALGLAMAFWGMAADVPFPFAGFLLSIGMAKGVLFPAMSSLIIAASGPRAYGRMFSFFSVASSVGAFLGPFLAGHVRDAVSPYFLAFVALMLAVSLLPFHDVRPHRIRWQRQH